MNAGTEGDKFPFSEDPSKGISVQVRQPDMLYFLAQGVQEDKYGFLMGDISVTQIRDSLFSGEVTLLSASKDQKGKDTQEAGLSFGISSVIYLSEERRKQNDSGYYSYDKVKRVDSLLREMGVNSSFNNIGEGGRSTITVEKEGLYAQVNFGLPDRGTHVEQLTKELNTQTKLDLDADKSTSQVLRDGPTNESISIALVDGRQEDPLLRVTRLAEALTDEADFTKRIFFYAEVYQKVLNAIYKEEGIVLPDISIVLRPPAKNDDIITELHKLQEKNPLPVAREQLRRAERVGFDEIAGQDEAVAEAKRLVLAINNPEVFEKRGAKRPKGILFHGPPGTGKTLIAKAIAEEADAEFLSISTPDIASKWYGEPEKLIQNVFNRANEVVRKGKKVILFFDELDALAPSREGSHEATKKVVATILQNMDGMSANPNVTVIAASNRPQDIDIALKRPGRLDKLIYVGLPNKDGRAAILKVHIEKAKRRAKGSEELFDPQINLEDISMATDGMSGADLANMVNLLLEDKLMRELEGTAWTPATTNEMINVVNRVKADKIEKRKMGFVKD